LNASLKLQKHFKTGDRLVVLSSQGHGGINDNESFQKELKELLAQ
jgi:hypothetical protein